MNHLGQLESEPNNCSLSSCNDTSSYYSANDDTLEDIVLPALSPSIDVSPESETLNIGNSVGNPRVVEDSTSSSTSVELPSGAISKTTSLKIPRLTSKIIPWNAITRNATIRKHTLSKPSSMHISSKPTMNKKVTIDFQMLMPTQNLGLSKNGKFSLKKPSTKSSTMAGPSKKSINLTVMNICEPCNKSFDLRASLMVHKLKHNNVDIICKYCHITFKKPTAYSTHLKEKCSKIPFADRRKILIRDNNKLLH